MRKNNLLKKLIVIGMSAIMLAGQSTSVLAATYTVGTPNFVSKTVANYGYAYKRVVSATTSSSEKTDMKTEVWCTYHMTGTSVEQQTPGQIGYGVYSASTTEVTTCGKAYIFDKAKNEGSYRGSDGKYVHIDTKSIKID